jgi:phage gp45-like
LTIPNIIVTKDKTTNNAHIVSNTPSLTRTRLLTPNYAIINNIHFATKQTSMTINNTNQQVTDNIDLAKKQMQTINRTTKNWLKVESKEVVHEKFPYMNP